jgi:hypothetical protein
MDRLFRLLAAAALVGFAAAPTTVHADEPQLSVATVAPTSESHLPTWVQTVVAHTSLYEADSSSDQVATLLTMNTYLRVIDGGTSRLEVQAYDDGGNPAQTGWVDADQVAPAAPAVDWLVAASATTLWSSDDGSATALRTLASFTPLQKTDGPVLNRIQVRAYRSDFSGVVDQGWVDVADTGPALPPQARVPATTDVAVAASGPRVDATQQAFLDAAGGAAREQAALTHVPASVTVAQAILESNWGRSALAQNANNFFGMKATGTLGNDGVVWMPTSEYNAAGALYTTVSAFRAYKSLADSTADHDQLLANASRYASAMHVAGDPRQFATLIAQDGYATDPQYASKLIDLMDRYNLYQLDS